MPGYSTNCRKTMLKRQSTGRDEVREKTESWERPLMGKL